MTKQDRNEQGRFEQLYEEPLAKSPLCVRFPQSINDVLAEMPDRTIYIRQAVADQLRRDGLLRNSERDEQ